jgi:hypothetical protein
MFDRTPVFVFVKVVDVAAATVLATVLVAVKAEFSGQLNDGVIELFVVTVPVAMPTWAGIANSKSGLRYLAILERT